MRKITLALGALAAVSFALPMTSPAQAEDKTVIVKHGDHHDWDHHHHHKTVIIKHGHDHDHD